MSETMTAPSGLDVLTAEDLAEIGRMRGGEATEPEPQPQPAPQAAPEAAPEAEAFDPEDDAGAGQRQDMVPHKNFHAVNERRKAAEKRAQEAELKAARMEERLNLLSEAISAAPQAAQPEAPPAAAVVEEEAVPDVNTDPIGHFRAVSEREAKARAKLAEQVEALTGMVRGSQEAQTRQQQVAQLQQWGSAQERQFMQQEPSYAEAMNWLRQSRHDELEAIGVADPAERERIINNDVTAIAMKARQDGANFPERLFNLSRKRGYAPAAPAAPAIPPLDAEPAASRRQPNRDNTTSIGSLGSAPPARLSADKIADMSEAEFAALIGKVKARGGDIRDVLGY